MTAASPTRKERRAPGAAPKVPEFPSFPLTPQRLELLIKFTDLAVKHDGIESFNPAMQDFIGTLGGVIEKARALGVQTPPEPPAPPAT